MMHTPVLRFSLYKGGLTVFFFRKRTLPPGISASRFACRRGSLTIRGTEYRPQGEHLPIAIACHGFMANQDTVRQYALALAGMGYAAFCFDFCGGCVVKGKSDGKTTDMSVLTETQDLRSVLAYARSLPYTDGDNVLLLGCSQGGFVCALTAADPENRVHDLVLIYPALCIPDDARAGHMMFAHFDPANVPETFRCGPMKLGRRYVTDVIRMGPYEEIQPYQGNVLILHGSGDTLVRPEYSRRAYEAYQASGPADRRVQHHVIEGAGHGFSASQDEEAIGILRQFLTR